MKKTLCLFAMALFVLSPRIVSAQASATANITAGRNQLKLQTPAALAQADSFFGKAITNNSSNLEANLLKAATSLILEQNSSQFQAQLTGVGVTINDNDIYNFLYTPPVDSDGFYSPTSGVTTNNTLTYIKSKMSLIDAALANLAKFGNATTSNFAINLTAQEISLEDVRIDYGDVLMLRALLKAAKAYVALMSSYNSTAEYAKIAYIEKNFGRFGKETPQLILETFPDLMKFSTPDQRAAAKTLIIQANADYQLAHSFIMNNRVPGTYPNLFEYANPEEADTSAAQINAVVVSLNANADLPIPDTGVTINPSKILSSTTPLRGFLTSNSSQFEYGYPVRSSWPDPTFGGAVKAGSAILLDSLEDTFKETRVEQRLWRMAERPTRKGTIKAWGSNSSGQTAVPAGLTNVVQIAAGGNHSLALKADGSVSVWGSNNVGQASLPPIVTTLAGSGRYGSTDGQGTAASFSYPSGVAVDASGNVYVADAYSHKIRKVTPSGNVTTLAGSGSSGSTDGQGTAASFSSPSGVAVDASGNVYVADAYSHKIRKVTPSGNVTTLAGSGSYGSTDGQGTAASFSYPSGVAVDASGNVYVADANSHKIRKVTASIFGLPDVNQISAGENHSLAIKADGTVLGWGSNAHNQLSFDPYYWLDSPAVQVSAGGNHSLALDSEGNIIAWGDDTNGQAPWGSFSSVSRAIQVAAGGTHSLALTSYGSVMAWGNNANGQTTVPAGFSQASFGEYPKGVAVDSSGNVYLADTQNNKIRKITANGTVTTLAGTGEWGSNDGSGATATFSEPKGIAVDTSGNVYVSEPNYGRIRKITSSGTVTTLTDSVGWVEVLVVSGTTIYASDTYGHRILKISSGGAVSTLAGSGNEGSSNGKGSAASFYEPRGLAIDSSGNVYVADLNYKIRKISANGTVTNFVGSGNDLGADGVGSQASFGTIRGMVMGSDGALYVADTSNYKIRKVTSSGVVTTLAGTGWYGSTDGTGAGATFKEPSSIAFHGLGLYVAENYKIRKVSTTGVVTTFSGAETYGSQDGIAVMAAGNKITQIAAGGAHSLALTANRTVIAWGDNSSGQCSVPAGLTGVVQIAAGKNHSIAVKADGTIVRWGSASSGMGSIPSGITTAIQASGGGAHSMVLVASGPLGAPEITFQPISQSVYANTNVSFSITARGANLAYQWLRNGSAVAGAVAATHTFAASPSNIGNYTVRVSNSLGNVTSSPARLTLLPAASWTWTNSGPSTPVQVGGNATFAVGSVTGPGTISYQWFKNGVPLSGKTTPALSITPIQISDGGVYSLRITTSAGNITAEPNSLVVSDSTILVYSLKATGNNTTGIAKSTATFGGFLVRERATGKSHFFWLDTNKKSYFYELRTDLTEESTGPFVGSTSVVRGYASNPSDEEMVWISGTDAISNLNNTIKTLAPTGMIGQINSVIKDQNKTIEILNVRLELNVAQTLKARTSDANNPATTITRITNEIKSLGYRE